MAKRPANVTETTQQLIDAGIAHRMLCESSQWHLPNDTQGCSFWVERENHPDYGESTSVVVQYPPNGHTQSFAAARGESFGIAGDPPLNDAQMALVERLASEYKQANASA